MKPFLLVVSLVFVAVACGADPAPTPNPGERPVHVLDIYGDYLQNEPRANADWKNRWLYVEMPVDVVENHGAIYFLEYYRGALADKAIMDFKDEERLLDIEAGQQLKATCKLTGLILGYMLSFRDCQ